MNGSPERKNIHAKATFAHGFPTYCLDSPSGKRADYMIGSMKDECLFLCRSLYHGGRRILYSIFILLKLCVLLLWAILGVIASYLYFFGVSVFGAYEYEK